MQEFKAHRWKPITDLPEDWETELSDAALLAFVNAWKEQAQELRNRSLYRTFLAKLKRQWAIETGVIEGIYSISEGATTTLIEKGFEASFLSHEDTDLPAYEVIAKIQDQERAINELYDFISGNRTFGTFYVKELHQILTAHQDTYIARDTLGNLVERQLPKGAWKTMPNNVEHPDGGKFEYCPPEYVAAEMDQLLYLHQQHELRGVTPDIQAAWLHHRFTLIHPFTDGNGRIARCLATLVLLKSSWLPLVITRQNRDDYIDSLRLADAGNLLPLIQFIRALQRKAIRQALSLGEEVLHEANALEGVLQNIKIKFSNDQRKFDEYRSRAMHTANAIHEISKEKLSEVAAEVHEAITHAGTGFRAIMVFGDPETEKARFNYIQIIECAKKLEYFADLNRYQAIAGIVIDTIQRTEIMFSIHGIGRDHAGILGVSGMVYSKSKAEDGVRYVSNVEPLSNEPFEFAYAELPESVITRFRPWMDQCLTKGLDWWQQQL